MATGVPFLVNRSTATSRKFYDMRSASKVQHASIDDDPERIMASGNANIKRSCSTPRCYKGRIRALEQETRELDMERMQNEDSQNQLRRNYPAVIYQNFHREFRCTAIAYDPSPPANDSEVRPLKKFKIKFSVMNGKKALTLTFKTFTESTGLNYYDGTYVSHPSLEAVKAELAKIIENLILLDKTPKKKWKSHTVTPTLPKSHVPETFGALSKKKRKTPKSKKTTPETQVTPSNVPTKDSKKTQSPANKGLPSMISDEGTVKTMSLPERPHEDKDSEGFKLPADIEPSTTHVVDPLGTDAKYQVDQTQSTRLTYRSLTKNKGETSSEMEPHNQTLLLSTAADVQALFFDEELIEESEDDIFEAGDNIFKARDEIDEYIHHTDEEETKQLEAVASYADLKSEIEGFYDAAYKVHEGTEASFSTYEKLLVNFQAQFGKDAKKILGSLKVIQDAVKEDLAFNQKGENFTHVSTGKPPSHTKSENECMEPQKTKVEKEPKKETTKEVPARPTRAVPISTISPITRTNPKISLIQSSSRPPLTDTIHEIQFPQPTGRVIDITPPEQPESPSVVPKANKRKGIVTTKTKEPTMKLVPASRKLTRMKKEEKIKKAIEEAKLLAMSKLELIKVVQEEAPKFADFGITELDELGTIIEKKKKNIVGELMISLGKRKMKHMELEPKIRFPGLECNESIPEGVPIVNNIVIE
nr:hypothetical protein [Tanacetum cinerariifolium]